MATELALELISFKAAVMPFPLADAQGDQATGDGRELYTFRAHLTATQAELIPADVNDFR